MASFELDNAVAAKLGGSGHHCSQNSSASVSRDVRSSRQGSSIIMQLLASPDLKQIWSCQRQAECTAAINDAKNRINQLFLSATITMPSCYEHQPQGAHDHISFNLDFNFACLLYLL
jgi:hypothetical protein